MYFDMKSYLKNTRNHTPKHAHVNKESMSKFHSQTMPCSLLASVAAVDLERLHECHLSSC
jgi:hypothetical protein